MTVGTQQHAVLTRTMFPQPHPEVANRESSLAIEHRAGRRDATLTISNPLGCDGGSHMQPCRAVLNYVPLVPQRPRRPAESTQSCRVQGAVWRKGRTNQRKVGCGAVAALRGPGADSPSAVAADSSTPRATQEHPESGGGASGCVASGVKPRGRCEAHR